MQEAYTAARTAWRAEAATLAEMARKLEDINEAWYADATRVFAADTPEGDMIRKNIPTTYTPPPPKPPAPPAPPATPQG